MKSIARTRTNEVFHPKTLVLNLSVDVVGKVIIDLEFNGQRVDNGMVLALPTSGRLMHGKAL